MAHPRLLLFPEFGLCYADNGWEKQMEDDFVYSTGEEDLRKKKKRDQTFSVRPAGIKNDGIIRVQREKKGRGGKTVFLVYGMPVPRAELKEPEKYMKLGRYFMKKHANENGKEVV